MLRVTALMPLFNGVKYIEESLNKGLDTAEVCQKEEPR